MFLFKPSISLSSSFRRSHHPYHHLHQLEQATHVSLAARFLMCVSDSRDHAKEEDKESELPESWRMTSLKRLLCGDIKKHVELEDDFKSYTDLRSAIMRWATNKRLERDRQKNDMEIDAIDKGEGEDEKAFVKACANKDFQVEIGKEVLSVDPSYYRPTEVDLLIGDPSKAKNKLGWVTEHDLASLVKDMMQSDVKLMQKNQYLKNGGYEISKNLE